MKIMYKIFWCVGICCFFLFLATLKVQASEIEMEKRERVDDDMRERYDISFSKYWFSEGKTIKAYDVSKNEQIAIAFSNSTIAVFNKDMEFQYEISFKMNSAYGVLWKDEQIMLIDIRSDIAVEFNEAGQIINSYDITDTGNYNYEIIFNREREAGGNKYFCTNQSIDLSGAHLNYYTVLKKIDENGMEFVIYESNQRIDGILFGILILAGFGVVGILTAVIIGCYIVKEKNKYLST